MLSGLLCPENVLKFPLFRVILDFLKVVLFSFPVVVAPELTRFALCELDL